MQTLGHIQNGVVVLDEGVRLPEGTRVSVSVLSIGRGKSTPGIRSAAVQRPVALPIFDYDGPPDIGLTNERIAEILDRDDASA
jgi:hypothetical protein